MSLVHQARYAGNNGIVQLSKDIAKQLLPHAKKRAGQLAKKGYGHLKRKAEEYLRKKPSNKRARPVNSRGVPNTSAVGSKGAGYTRRSRKVLKKSKRLPKVSRQFKKKVAAALQGRNYKGRYETQYHYILYNPTVNSVAWYVGGLTVISNKFTTASPNEIMDAASILWNQKTPATNWNVTTNNMPLASLKLQVKNIITNYEVVNNTQRQQRIWVYECMPRSNTAEDPILDWTQVLANDVFATTLPGPNISNETVANPATNVYTTNEGPRPEYHAQWKKMWNHKKSLFVVEGGEKFTYKVSTGAFIFDPLKFLDGDDLVAGQFPYYAKGLTRIVFFRIEPEITFANDGHAGMDIDVGAAASTAFHVHVVQTKRFFLEMPDAVQGLDPAVAGNAVTAYNRHDAYNFRYIYDLTARDAGGMIDVDDPDEVVGTDPAAGAPL